MEARPMYTKRCSWVTGLLQSASLLGDGHMVLPFSGAPVLMRLVSVLYF